MNTLLGVGDWFAQNWTILLIIVIAIALLVPTYIRQKKETTARNEMNESIRKGVKIITTAGVYGVVESVQSTTDGKVVVIKTGDTKNPSTMTIHINAIGGIDNKKPVVEGPSEETKSVITEEKIIEEEKIDDEAVAEIEAAVEGKTTKPKTTKKSSNKSKK